MFLKQYWQKQPCLIRSGFANVEPLISPDELAGLSCESDVESRLIKQGPTALDWQVEYGPFSEATFNSLPQEKWTLLVQGVEQWLPEAYQLLKEFSFLPNWRVDDLMVSYAAPGGSVGPHLDHYDVFLIQGMGEREWHISDQAWKDEVLIEGLDLKILKEFVADKVFTLNQGDILYLPPRFAHHGIALSESMTLSVGFRAPHQTELLSNYSHYLNIKNSREIHLHDGGRSVCANPGHFAFQDRRKFQKLLQDSFSGLEFDRWLAVYLTMPKLEYEFAAEEISSLPSCFEKRTGTRWVYFIEGENLYLFVDGREWVIESLYEPLIQILTSDQIQFNFEDIEQFKSWPQDMMFELFKLGLLVPLEG